MLPELLPVAILVALVGAGALFVFVRSYKRGAGDVTVVTLDRGASAPVTFEGGARAELSLAIALRGERGGAALEPSIQSAVEGACASVALDETESGKTALESALARAIGREVGRAVEAVRVERLARVG